MVSDEKRKNVREWLISKGAQNPTDEDVDRVIQFNHRIAIAFTPVLLVCAIGGYFLYRWWPFMAALIVILFFLLARYVILKFVK